MEFSYEIGIAAGVLFVLAFGLLNFGVIKAESAIYQALNFFGALGFIYTAVAPFNPGLMITQVAWAVVAALGVYKIFFGRGKAKLEADEPQRENSARHA